MYITEQEVIDYMFIRTDEELRHCPLAISEATYTQLWFSHSNGQKYNRNIKNEIL